MPPLTRKKRQPAEQFWETTEEIGYRIIRRKTLGNHFEMALKHISIRLLQPSPLETLQVPPLTRTKVDKTSFDLQKLEGSLLINMSKIFQNFKFHPWQEPTFIKPAKIRSSVPDRHQPSKNMRKLEIPSREGTSLKKNLQKLEVPSLIGMNIYIYISPSKPWNSMTIGT